MSLDLEQQLRFVRGTCTEPLGKRTHSLITLLVWSLPPQSCQYRDTHNMCSSAAHDRPDAGEPLSDLLHRVWTSTESAF